MTSHEDRLRQLLQAEGVAPAGDGLQRIQQRLAKRRALRSRLVPIVAVAGVIAVAAAAAAVTATLTGSRALTPAHPRTTITAPELSSPSPSPSPSAGVTTAGSGTPIWPFTTDQQAAEWETAPGSRPWAADPVQVTQHLMDDYLKLPGKATRQVDNDGHVAVVEVSAGGRAVSRVQLQRVGRDPQGPWSVVSASSENLAVTQPKDGVEVTSPLHAAGTVRGVDQSVQVRLISDVLLAEAYAPAGMERPWMQSLAWTRSDWSVAALTASTFNGKGDLSAVTVTAVRRAGATG